MGCQEQHPARPWGPEEKVEVPPPGTHSAYGEENLGDGVWRVPLIKVSAVLAPSLPGRSL